MLSLHPKDLPFIFYFSGYLFLVKLKRKIKFVGLCLSNKSIKVDRLEAMAMIFGCKIWAKMLGKTTENFHGSCFNTINSSYPTSFDAIHYIDVVFPISI